MFHRLALVLTVLVIGVIAAPALAAAATMNAGKNPVQRGQVTRVYGKAEGCGGDSIALISRAFPNAQEFAGVPAVFTPVGAQGGYSVRIRIPAGRAPGRYRVSGRCGGANIGVGIRLRVTA